MLVSLPRSLRECKNSKERYIACLRVLIQKKDEKWEEKENVGCGDHRDD